MLGLVKRAAGEVSRATQTHIKLSTPPVNAMIEVRCSGEVPRCSNCQIHSLECQYEPARRDRLKEYDRIPIPELFTNCL